MQWPGGLAVLEPAAVPEALVELHGELAARLDRLGLAVERRRFRPHVTLARQAAAAIPPTEPVGIGWAADGGYLLVHSLPGGRGYQPLARYG